jgi:hypothetical protein
MMTQSEAAFFRDAINRRFQRSVLALARANRAFDANHGDMVYFNALVSALNEKRAALRALATVNALCREKVAA